LKNFRHYDCQTFKKNGLHTLTCRYNIEKDIAAYIKKEFDKKYNPTWHCIVGRNFGSYVTHETKHFIYFYLGQVAILLFKSG
jgi:dynein light chain LC8-type